MASTTGCACRERSARPAAPRPAVASSGADSARCGPAETSRARATRCGAAPSARRTPPPAAWPGLRCAGGAGHGPSAAQRHGSSSGRSHGTAARLSAARACCPAVTTRPTVTARLGRAAEPPAATRGPCHRGHPSAVAGTGCPGIGCTDAGCSGLEAPTPGAQASGAQASGARHRAHRHRVPRHQAPDPSRHRRSRHSAPPARCPSVAHPHPHPLPSGRCPALAMTRRSRSTALRMPGWPACICAAACCPWHGLPWSRWPVPGPWTCRPWPTWPRPAGAAATWKARPTPRARTRPPAVPSRWPR